jgi:DNA-binding NarL/FixJ family response regulator
MVLHRDLDWRNCRAANLVYAVNADLRLTQATASVGGETRSRGRAKLLPPTIREIRRLRAAGQTQKTIADSLHLPWRQVGKVLRGEIYSHVQEAA